NIFHQQFSLPVQLNLQSTRKSYRSGKGDEYLCGKSLSLVSTMKFCYNLLTRSALRALALWRYADAS
ncbi:MAG TPA: hypothetical protein PL044_10440, partial [Clostridiales bacterium]|nr:hypothetical protein [Clostridiales bacterium]HQK74172.1 hypothetical protein [Clostridiales bacterium]